MHLDYGRSRPDRQMLAWKNRIEEGFFNTIALCKGACPKLLKHTVVDAERVEIGIELILP